MFYDTNKSITQSLRSQAGRSLETLVEHNFATMGISFAKQVFVKDNIVCKKKGKGGHVLDFVVPKPDIGSNVADFIHISCKTTLRERVHQDQHIQCKKNIVITYDTKTTQATANGFTCITLTRGTETKELVQLKELLMQ